jgi:hypothetical protein
MTAQCVEGFEVPQGGKKLVKETLQMFWTVCGELVMFQYQLFKWHTGSRMVINQTTHTDNWQHHGTRTM